MHPEAHEAFLDGIAKLEEVKIPNVDSEITKQYLDWLTSMPWGEKSKDNLNIIKAKTILDEVRNNLSFELFGFFFAL
jgi:Lon-like ATP-dependent protease